MSVETFAFQAEINQLLSLIINTFYKNKEVFLRELISNASDAIDKIRYLSLTDSSVLGDDPEFRVKICPDEKLKTLVIHDNGIGMTKKDLIENLGTIAHSGTRAFMEVLQKGGKDVSMIGQFGVGFYSSFLVADRVQVLTKHNDDVTYMWESIASGSFTISQVDPVEDLKRGTKVILYLKDDQKKFSESKVIAGVIDKHSKYISHPIYVYGKVDIQQNSMPGRGKGDGDSDDGIDEDSKAEEWEWKHVNTQLPIWMRPVDTISDDEYMEFYKSISYDRAKPFAMKHFSLDGGVQFKSILYVPRVSNSEIYTTPDRKRNNIKLYVKRVLITDQTNDLLPEYLSFIQGVVDCDDLPLNVSREMLQQNNVMSIIKRNLTKKCIDMFTELSNDADRKEDWLSFYREFGRYMKIAVHEDSKNKKRYSELLRFPTSKSGGQLVGFREYVSRMKTGQKTILFLVGDNLQTLQTSPLVEKFKHDDYEVVFMAEPVDEYMVQSLVTFDDKPFENCGKEGNSILDENYKEIESIQKDWQPVCDEIKSILGERVVDVRITDRLVTHPCVLVTDKYGASANMERIMKAQTLGKSMLGVVARKHLQINPNNKIITTMKELVERKEEGREKLLNMVQLLYDTVTIDSGFEMTNPTQFAARIYKYMESGADI